ncbi:MAG: hypothetical protein NTW19_07330 [Planctomycetota bacterium]|nr:hypothetical protein [Planctomycetota bacterium]
MAERYDEQMILGYLEGDLSPDQVASFEALLGQDARLRNLVAQLLLDRNALRKLPQTPAPPELLDRVNQSLERRMLLGSAQPEATTTAPAERYRITRLLAYAALLAFVCVGGALVIRTLIDPKLNNLATSKHPATPSSEFAMAPPPAPAPGSPGAAGSSSELRNTSRLSGEKLNVRDSKAIAVRKFGRDGSADAMPHITDEPAFDVPDARMGLKSAAGAVEEKTAEKIATLADSRAVRDANKIKGLAGGSSDWRDNANAAAVLSNGRASASNAVAASRKPQDDAEKSGVADDLAAAPAPAPEIRGVSRSASPGKPRIVADVPGARVVEDLAMASDPESAAAILRSVERSNPVGTAAARMFNQLVTSLNEPMDQDPNLKEPDVRLVVSAARAEAVELSIREWAGANGAEVLAVSEQQNAALEVPGGSPRVGSQSSLRNPPVKQVMVILDAGQIEPLMRHLNGRAGLSASVAPLPTPSRPLAKTRGDEYSMRREIAAAAAGKPAAGPAPAAAPASRQRESDFMGDLESVARPLAAEATKTEGSLAEADNAKRDPNKELTYRRDRDKSDVSKGGRYAAKDVGHAAGGSGMGAGGGMGTGSPSATTQPAAGLDVLTQTALRPTDRVALPIFIQLLDVPAAAATPPPAAPATSSPR